MKEIELLVKVKVLVHADSKQRAIDLALSNLKCDLNYFDNKREIERSSIISIDVVEDNKIVPYYPMTVKEL